MDAFAPLLIVNEVRQDGDVVRIELPAEQLFPFRDHLYGFVAIRLDLGIVGKLVTVRVRLLCHGHAVHEAKGGVVIHGHDDVGMAAERGQPVRKERIHFARYFDLARFGALLDDADGIDHHRRVSGYD